MSACSPIGYGTRLLIGRLWVRVPPGALRGEHYADYRFWGSLWLSQDLCY